MMTAHDDRTTVQQIWLIIAIKPLGIHSITKNNGGRLNSSQKSIRIDTTNIASTNK